MPLGAIRDFMSTHYLHFNARELVEAAKAYEAHIEEGGKMLVAIAGAMSTGELGISLARMIRAGKVHAISCTGANLEEDVFNLVAGREYEIISSWRDLSAADELRLCEKGMNRVTDTCIPETVMRHIEGRLLEVWKRASAMSERKLPSEFMFEILADPGLRRHFDGEATNSWLLAAKEAGVPVYVPGGRRAQCGLDGFFRTTGLKRATVV